MSAINAERLITVKELADQLGVKESWVRSALMRGSLPSKKLGGLVRFSQEEIQLWMEMQSKNTETILSETAKSNGRKKLSQPSTRTKK